MVGVAITGPVYRFSRVAPDGMVVLAEPRDSLSCDGDRVLGDGLGADESRDQVLDWVDQALFVRQARVGESHVRTAQWKARERDACVKTFHCVDVSIRDAERPTAMMGAAATVHALLPGGAVLHGSKVQSAIFEGHCVGAVDLCAPQMK